MFGTDGGPGSYLELSLSPDDSRLAVVRADYPPQIWIHDLATEASARTRFLGSSVKPIWSPDSSQIVFASNRGTAFDIFRLTAASSQGPERLHETDGMFSPDGRLVAYVSDESGAFEVYVRSFASAGGKWRVSNGGGYQPRWRRDGRELFYFTADGRLMSAAVPAGTGFQPGAPTTLFRAPIFGGGATTTNHYWDTTADGQRFLINTVPPEATASALTVILNWQRLLQP